MDGSSSSRRRRRSQPDVNPPYLDVPSEREDPFAPPQEFTDLRGRVDPAPFEFHAGHRGWVVTGHALAKKVLADRRFSVRPDLAHSDGAAQLRSFAGPGLFHLADPPEHGRWRGSVTAEFTPAKAQVWEPVVQKLADECIDELLRENPHGSGDFVTGFAVTFPAKVMLEVLGLPTGAGNLFLYAARRNAGDKPKGALSMLAGLFKEKPAGARDLLWHAARRAVTRTNSGEDRAEALAMLTGFLKQTMTGMAETDGFLGRLANRDGVDADEAAGIAAQILVAGSMVPTNMLGVGLYLLLSRPDGLGPFASSVETAERATEELFRYLTFESQPRIRVATEDVEIGGTHISAGQLVAVVLETANRDPEVFPDADVLDLNRDASRHMAFGWGNHQCLGQSLARLEIRVALQRLAVRLPDLRLADTKNVAVRDDAIAHSVSTLPVRW